MYNHDDISDPDGSLRIIQEEAFLLKEKRKRDEELEARLQEIPELFPVGTPQGLQWLELDDPRIPLYIRWEDGEIPTYVLEQEIAQLN
jgi:hypothetical protein